VGVGARGEGTPLKEMFLLWATLMARGDDRDTRGEGDLMGDGPDRGSDGRPNDQLLFGVVMVVDGMGVGAGGRGELA
jgi:hypothetical protein